MVEEVRHQEVDTAVGQVVGKVELMEINTKRGR